MGRVAVIMASSLTLSGLGVAPAHAAPDPTLTVHYTDSTPSPVGGVTAQLLDGTAPTSTEVTGDAYGETTRFAFDGDVDGPVGFRVTADSVFGDDLRYVRPEAGSAEVWVVDGDPRAYGEPIAVDDADVRVQDRAAYLPVSSLEGYLDVRSQYGRNGYRFDGAATGTIDILTMYRGRDYFEIAVDTNRIGSNVTGNMLNAYTDLVFDDVDGFRDGDDYFLSLSAIERIFQVGTLVHPEGVLLLEPQHVAHDQLAEADPASVGFDPAKLDEIDAYVQRQVDDGGPAVAISVTKDGKLVKTGAWGEALRYSTSTAEDGTVTPAAELPEAEQIPAATDTLFDLASNSKMYATNYAIQRLVSEGRLDLDRTLQSFPGWEGFTDANSDYTGKWTVGGPGGIPAVYTGKETVTIRDILHHVGGMIPDPEYPNRASAGDLWYQTDDPDDRAGIVDAISRTPLRYAPRTVFAYSDVDFMILGLLVEQITGQRLDVYLDAEFYGPLGLEDTMYRPLAAGVDPDRIAATELNGNTRDGNVSFGALDDGTPVPMREYTLRGEVHDEKAYYAMGGVAGHAGLFSTAPDMAVLTQLMLNGGVYGGHEYFAKDVADEFVTPFSLNPATVGSATVGLGWRVHSQNAAAYYYFNWGPSRSTYGHQGWTGTLTVIDPLHQMTITILTNMRHSPVVSPPNGFAGANYPVADLAPLSGLVYRALVGESTDYVVESSVSAVDPIEVEVGTTADEVAAALPAEVDVTDTDGGVHRVGVTWRLGEFDGTTAGDVSIAGDLARPAWLVPAEGAEPLVASAAVTVRAATDPGTGEPGTGEPGTGEPGTGEPGTGEPGTGSQPAGSDPSGANAGDLASTGFPVAAWSTLAALILAAGGALAVIGLRRRARGAIAAGDRTE
ncbi:penicillin binding protein PBP4B [Agromyces intestinalis]|uniref:penicillin binding protein PBP4B n=1 Tax=Agromyces intestinalis TaxID=2592652 RepID=UPI00143DDE9A|nr:penicillin binding protein PBP4B [Agromyces intestinalis]